MKPIWKSKTFWFNLALGLVGLLEQQGVLTQATEQVNPETLALVGAVGNLVLRAVTKTPVTMR